MQLDGLQDGAFLRGLLGNIPEHTVVHRNRGNSFQVVPERRATFPEEFEVEASFTFSKDTRYSYELDRWFYTFLSSYHMAVFVVSTSVSGEGRTRA